MKIHPGQPAASTDELDESADLSRVGSGAVYVMRETRPLETVRQNASSGGEEQEETIDLDSAREARNAAATTTEAGSGIGIAAESTGPHAPSVKALFSSRSAGGANSGLGEGINGEVGSSQISVREGSAALAVDPESLQDQLEGSSLDQRLEIVATAFQDSRLAVVTSSGPASLIIIHTLHQLGIRLPVVFVDTLHHFPETLEHLERVRAKYDLDLRVYRAFNTREEFEAKHGQRLWERDLDLYQEVSKVEPFRRARSELDAWITGRRREQGQKRAELPIIEWGDQSKINPLADWNRTQVWRFILENEIPYNPLHDQGFASIGDAPLTTAIGDGEAERDGRWRGTSRTECGIHE